MVKDSNTIELDLPATHKYLNVIGPCISAMLARSEGVADLETVAYNIELGVHEICTNIVDHAYDNQPHGRIKVKMTLPPDSSRFVVELQDTGQNFDPTLVPSPDLNEVKVRGYGLFLAQSLLDAVNYDPHLNKNVWQLIKNL